MATEAELEAELEGLLKHHDWYYAYSDDSRVYASGRKVWDRMQALKKLVDPARGDALWLEHAPVAFHPK
jgi:hypothetical protein